MEWKIIHIGETDSTNRQMRDALGHSDGAIGSAVSSGIPVCLVADYQTAGRGCGTNRWESEPGQNLLFSLLIHPSGVAANRQFRISMAISLSICEALGRHIGDLSIKWPNDIYWRNAKIAGILIEHTLQGASIRDSIIGVGLNVNQRRFHSNAPNPISLWQICEQTTDREQLLRDILASFERFLYTDDVRSPYLSMLYRRRGYHPYTDRHGIFMAEIMGVEDDGHLLLCDDSGIERRYAFKEVQFVI